MGSTWRLAPLARLWCCCGFCTPGKTLTSALTAHVYPEGDRAVRLDQMGPLKAILVLEAAVGSRVRRIRRLDDGVVRRGVVSGRHLHNAAVTQQACEKSDEHPPRRRGRNVPPSPPTCCSSGHRHVFRVSADVALNAAAHEHDGIARRPTGRLLIGPRLSLTQTCCGKPPGGM